MIFIFYIFKKKKAAVNDYDYGVDLDYFIYTDDDNEDDDEEVFGTSDAEPDEADFGINGYSVYGFSDASVLACSVALVLIAALI